jgi:hypothetical protein
VLLPYYHTQEGRIAFTKFLTTHETEYPLYMKEIEGMSQASGVPFSTLFLQNLALEYSSVAQPGSYVVDACSDYQMCTAERCIVGHNDDNDSSLLNHTALITAQFGDHVFTAFTYLGIHLTPI